MKLRHWIAVLAGHPRPWRLALARALEWTGLSPLFTIRLDGYRLRFYPTNTSANLFIDPNCRVHGLALFRDYIKAGDTAIDVGANIGEVSILFSLRAGPAGRVRAFEPHPRTFTYLLGNLALNRCANTVARNVALGAAPGTVRLTDDKHDDMNRVVETGAREAVMSTLDLEVPDEGPIAFLKVDVEGSELRVLEGGPATLARTRCVNCEMGEDHYRRYGYGMSDLIRFLQARGFETFVTGDGRVIRRVDAGFAEAGGHELVAVRDVADFVSRTGWTLQ